MIPQQVEVKEHIEVTPTEQIFTIQILKDSAEEGNPDYEPDVVVITQGYTIEWTNVDSVTHTVTSAVDFGETFNSGLMDAEDVFTLDTSNLVAGEYEYLCIVHPLMVGTVNVE